MKEQKQTENISPITWSGPLLGAIIAWAAGYGFYVWGITRGWNEYAYNSLGPDITCVVIGLVAMVFATYLSALTLSEIIASGVVHALEVFYGKKRVANKKTKNWSWGE